MLEIRALELHVSYACNLACEGCSHYSDQGHKGLTPVADADRWMRSWAGRVRPRAFSLLGGEPALHPDLPGFVALARDHWPGTPVRVVSNGFLLHRHPALPAALAGAPGSWLEVSVHHNSPEYRARFAPVGDLLRGWVQEHGVRVVVLESYANWTRRYRGLGGGMEPFADGRPRASWERCPALAYLPMQAARHRLSAAWDPYLAYRPLEPDCSDAELAAFFAREDEPACRMCPAEPEWFRIPLPLRGAAGA
ncbi:MAG TPA: radical SAM protein [Urbifossiella sp.]|nr:radical SAM protein [Urbifossiella sp.]